MLKVLERGYPRMYIYVMTQLGELEVVKAYREKCKRFKYKYADSLDTNYSYYVHGWFLVWLEEQRAAGKIK